MQGWGDDQPFNHIRISIALNRREKIASAVGSWNFSAHDFTDDELLHAALAHVTTCACDAGTGEVADIDR
jgi:hypothetical protein